MAYPFSRFASAPQTPQPVQSSEAPKEVMVRKPPLHRTARRTIAVVLATLALFLWWTGAFSSKSSRQTDRIPFSQNSIEEQVRDSPPFRPFANPLL